MAEGVTSSQKWREWVPLTGVLEQLPQHFQQGVDTANLQITCIASLPKHLVLGTNVGLVYLAHLPTPSLMRLKCENPLSPITDVGTVSTVDEMIAAGSLDGTITIFQLPRVSNFQASSSSGTDYRGITLPQPVIKRFTVGSVHRTSITSLTWSRNGMRLFCGDAQGIVSQIDINYQTSECTAKELLREEYSIVQLSYSFKLLAVSTLERTLIYNLTDESIHQVGKKPRKHAGVFGCLWLPSASQADSVLYASRPGLRLWSANTEGEVRQTHIIKELPENAQMQLLEPSYEKPKKGENFSFGILNSLNSYVVAHNPHWLFIIDIENLRVCNYCGQFGRIIDLAISEREIFILDGSRHITCLSIEPPDIGEKKPMALGPGIFLESENLKELKSRIVSQGSGILSQIARVGSSVAAKVTEHAKPPIVAGQNIKTKPYQDASLHAHKESPTKKSIGQSSAPTNITDGREHGHQRSSSSGIISEPQPRESSPSLIPPRMVQSVSNFFPSLLSTPSLVKTFGKTPPFNDFVISGEPQTPADFEEVVSSSQIVAQDGADLEPLVLRDKPKRKGKKKHETSSPEGGNIKCKSSDSSALSNNISLSSSPSCASPYSNTSTNKNSPENGDLLEEVSRQLSFTTLEDCNLNRVDATYGMTNNKMEDESIANEVDGTTNTKEEDSNSNRVDAALGLINSEKSRVDVFEGMFDLEDTRTYEDFKGEIEKNESLLAAVLGLKCLALDHEAKPIEETEKDGDFKNHLVLDREHSVESTGCSTPSTLKEQSPLPDGACNDFLEQYYRNNASFTSVEGSVEVSSEKKEGFNEDNSCNCSLASNDGGERLGSNFSEDRLSCLSYGPPSGSSLVSLPGYRVPLMEGHDSFMNEPSAMFVVTDSSEIADISWSYSTAQMEETHQCNPEKMPGGWAKHKLPSGVIDFSVSEKMVAFLDSHGCLFCKQTSLDSWKKFKLTAKANQIAQSPSGSILWVLCGTNAYTVDVPDLEALPLAKMTLAARNVLNMSVDEQQTWFIREDFQVCVLPSTGGKGPCLVSCEEFRLVKIVCQAKVVWGLTDKGQVAFRIGMNSQSLTGHGWGLMSSPGSTAQKSIIPVRDIALGPGRKGWIIDTEGCLYFRPGVCAEYPQGQELKWWQAINVDHPGLWWAYPPGQQVKWWQLPGDISLKLRSKQAPINAILEVSQEGTWLMEPKSNLAFLHENEMKGHIWDLFLTEKWDTICAEGVYTDQGAICCLSQTRQLFVINPNTKCCVPLQFVNNERIDCVSQRPEAMWVLTSSGNVYIRVGLSAQSLLGTRWVELDLHQISDVHLRHISCGTEVVWATDHSGGVYMRQGPLTPPPAESLPPAWIEVEATPLKEGAMFDRVYVGMKTYMVWAVDTKHQVYVREAIFPEIPIGISWVHVQGILARELSISENEVYALALDGEIFKRTGVTETNYIGDTWEKIPGHLNRFSVTTDNRIWGLSDDRQICQHEVLLPTDLSNDRPEANHDVFLSDGSEDWEVL